MGSSIAGIELVKLLIADDHWLIRDSLKQVIRRLDKNHQLLEASDFEEALAILSTHDDIDLVLADLIMPGFDAFDGLQELRTRFPNVPVAVVSVFEDRAHVLRAVEQGVIGYIPKSSSPAEIERAFERILDGEVYFPRRLLEAAPLANAATTPNASYPDVGLLTNREREVIDLLGKGLSVQKIASELDVAAHTVRVHLSSLMRKLGLPDRAATIHFAINHAVAVDARSTR
ncbi:response regulator transcription factor [Beijerinckia sp. L45]|uniref:response regulator n=1 Tax=Beijerinckia sp. L45 TaxID=1641855 RepID=UPI001FEFC873|nr:response regulator transcription factor [Beijerinckia sp. L45]